MRTLALIYLLTALSCFGQPANLFPGAAYVATQTAAPVWWPTNIPNCSAFFSHTDLPPSSFFYGWTNEMASGEIYVNHGTVNPANTSAGVSFDGVSGDYLLDAGSTLWIASTNVTLWIALEVTSYAGSYQAILGTANTGGYSLYENNGSPSKFVNGVGQTVVANPPTNTIFTLLIQAGGGGSGGVGAVIYTNGVLSSTTSGIGNGANFSLYGIGRDAYGSACCPMIIHSFGLWTNAYNFTSTDQANIAAWLAAHP